MDSESIAKEKLLIVAFPSVGLVGAFALSYLVKQLGMEDIGELEFSKISPSFVIENGKVFGPTRIYQKNNFYAILAGIPLISTSAYDFVRKSFEFAKNNGINKVIIPRGLEIMGDPEIKPNSYGLAVNANSRALLDEYRLPPIPRATIFGADAGVISALRQSEIPSIVLYTTCRMKMPDDDAIIKAVETLASILKVKIETEKFEEKLEKLSKENERLIEETRKAFEKAVERPTSMPSPGVA